MNEKIGAIMAGVTLVACAYKVGYEIGRFGYNKYTKIKCKRNQKAVREIIITDGNEMNIIIK